MVERPTESILPPLNESANLALVAQLRQLEGMQTFPVLEEVYESSRQEEAQQQPSVQQPVSLRESFESDSQFEREEPAAANDHSSHFSQELARSQPSAQVLQL